MTDSVPLRQVAEKVAGVLRGEGEVLAVWFFGAAQRNRQWAESDVDLLVATENAPVAAETRLEQDGTLVHLYWLGAAEWAKQMEEGGNRFYQGVVGGGERLFARDDRFDALQEQVASFPTVYRIRHMVPHLEALVRWARDLRQRMALGDERPRRAAARQWEVDQNSASVLLIEKGIYPHNEPTTQALNARIFMPNMADPEEIEGFVRARLDEWILPLLRDYAAEGAFDEAILESELALGPSARLLELAADAGWLQREESVEPSLPINRLLYRPT